MHDLTFGSCIDTSLLINLWEQSRPGLASALLMVPSGPLRIDVAGDFDDVQAPRSWPAMGHWKELRAASPTRLR